MKLFIVYTEDCHGVIPFVITCSLEQAITVCNEYYVDTDNPCWIEEDELNPNTPMDLDGYSGHPLYGRGIEGWYQD